MSENYSKEMVINDLMNRAANLSKVMFRAEYFSEEEKNELEKKANDNITDNFDKIDDDLALAMVMTNGGLVYKKGSFRYFLGITQALLAKTVETAYGIKSDFMQRDENKDKTIYEMFTNEFFDKMFGEKGYRQLFSGDGEGFIRDFMVYGADQNEIMEFDRIISNSVLTGEYNISDWYKANELCKKVSKGRKLYESVPSEVMEKPIKRTI